VLEKLRIENFRRFKKLEFTRLKRVNLIAGKNNTGKTGVLEAPFRHRSSPARLVKDARERAKARVSSWRRLIIRVRFGCGRRRASNNKVTEA